MNHQDNNPDHLTRAQLALLTAQRLQDEWQSTNSETAQTVLGSNEHFNEDAYEELMDIPGLVCLADVKVRNTSFSCCCPDFYTAFALVYDMCLGRKVEERSLLQPSDTPVPKEPGSARTEDLLHQWITEWCGRCSNYVLLYHAPGRHRVQIIHSYPTISDAMAQIKEIIQEQIREMFRFLD